MRNMTFGSDPEFFVHSKQSVVPVCGWLGGTKEKHIPLSFGEIHEDGIAAEFTLPPNDSMAGMLDNAVYGVSLAMNHIVGIRPNLGLFHASEVSVPTATLETIGPMAMTFGCSPEYDSYRGGESVPTINPHSLMEGDRSWRFAGGHLHIGYKAFRPEVGEYVAAMLCDATIGLALVMYGEKQPRRRALYGAPGRFRPTSYGVEYRTPSNQWLYNGELRAAIIHGSDMLTNILSASPNAIRAKWNSINWQDVRQAIRTEDSGMASTLYRQL